MCIFLVKSQNETKNNILEKKISQLISDQVPKIAGNIQKNKPGFQYYSTFQFAWIDFEFHSKFKKNLKIVQEKNEEFVFEDLKAFALLPNNKKISYLANVVNLDDWVLDLIETPETMHYIYISETFDEDLTHYLKNKDDHFFKVLIKFSFSFIKKANRFSSRKLKKMSKITLFWLDVFAC